MLNWLGLAEDLPEELEELCKMGEQYSQLLESVSEHSIKFNRYNKEIRDLYFYFDRMRQKFKTIIMIKATPKVKEIKVPAEVITIQESEKGEEYGTLTVERFIKKFEDDLNNYEKNAQSKLRSSQSTTMDSIEKVHWFKSLESYIYDAISTAKSSFYNKYQPIDSTTRSNINRKVLKIIDWVLDNLDPIAQFFIENNPRRDDLKNLYPKFVSILSTLSSNEIVSKEIARKLKNKYHSTATFLSKIKNEEIEFGEDHIPDYLVVKIDQAKHIPFDEFYYNLSDYEIDQAFNFPNNEQMKDFWHILIQAVIQRAGLVSAQDMNKQKPTPQAQANE